MASYKDIQGFNIQNLSSDPVPFAQEKANNPYGGVWSSGGNLNLARSGAIAFGIQTSAVFTGGEGTPGKVGNTEVYNGSSWTEVNDLNTIRTSMGGSGNSSSTGLVFAGILPPASSPRYTGVTESWDGTNWTEVADVNTGRSGGSGFGKSSTAALLAGGEYGGVPAGTVTELWNGTSWTEVNDLNTGRIFTGPSGISTDGMISGGFNGSTVFYANVETWNGTSWTETTDINTARRSLGASGSTSTNQLIFKGNIAPGPNVANTESWDGAAWTEVNDAAVATYYIAGTGTSNLSALAAGGGPPFTASTEEWAFSGIPPLAPAAGYTDAIVGQIYYNTTTGSFKAIKNGGAPIGTWASGGSMNTGRAALASATYASQSASLAMGGYITPTPYLANTETYNGTSWTEVNDLNQGRWICHGFGIQTSAILGGGAVNDSATLVTNVESWDGTNWTETTNTTVTRRSYASAGASNTSGILIGGRNVPTFFANVESWNGSTWTEVNDLNTARAYFAGAGTQTSAIAFCGYNPGNANYFETWDGTSWTEIAEANTFRTSAASAGTSSSNALFISGSYAGTYYTNTEFWNGSSWTELNDLSAGTDDGGGTGSSTSALFFGGNNNVPTQTGVTQEFTAADFEITTLTTS